MATAHAVSKFALFFFWSALLVPPQILIMLFSRGKAAYILPTFWHKKICNTFGIEVECLQEPARDHQVLYVSNHISYLDIPVIASVFPASFVAKADVATWPVFGFLAKLQQTVFISRSRSAIAREKSALSDIVSQGKSLVIFPEGTSSDGSRILPFKSSLFGIAVENSEKLMIQPFTIELAEVDGHTVNGGSDRDLYAWHGDMTLMPHFWEFAKSKGAKVRLHFHAPLQVKEKDNRKHLAQTCHTRVASVIADSNKAEAA